MAGNVTGFQRPFPFKANATYTSVGMQQAVTYVAGSTKREIEVPETDNQVPAGVVTYQFTDRDGETVAVQLDQVVEIEAAEAIDFGDDIIVAAGGKAKLASGLTTGTVANVLGEAHRKAAVGEMVQVLIRPKKYTV